MATGAGKTRTVFALTDLFMRATWAKRVSFLADRTALVDQAVGAFTSHLPESAPVNLATEPNEDGRVFGSWPTSSVHTSEVRAVPVGSETFFHAEPHAELHVDVPPP